MSDLDLPRLVDRAAAHSPPMDVSLDEVIQRARGRRRQQRAAGAGMAVGGLALVGVLWWGLGGDGVLGSRSLEQPASSGQADQRGDLVLIDGGHDLSLTIERAVLHRVDDGTSEVEVTFDDGTTSRAREEQALNGHASLYSLGEVILLAHQAPPEGTDDFVVSQDDPGAVSFTTGEGAKTLVWHLMPTPVHPVDVLLVAEDEVSLLSGNPIEVRELADGEHAWRVEGQALWGVAGQVGGDMDGEDDLTSYVAMPTDQPIITDVASSGLVALLPAAAVEARLLDPASGQMVGGAVTIGAPLGDMLVAVGEVPDERAGDIESGELILVWRDQGNTWHDASAPGATLVGGLDAVTVGEDDEPSIAGQPLEEIDGRRVGGSPVYRLPEIERLGQQVGLVVLPGLTLEDTMVPVSEKGTGREPAPRLILGTRQVPGVDTRPAVLVAFDLETAPPEMDLLVRRAPGLSSHSADSWQLLGTSDARVVELDGGAIVTVFTGADLWAIAPADPERTMDPQEYAARTHLAVLGAGPVLEHVRDGGATVDVVTILPSDQRADLITAAGATVVDTTTTSVDGTDLVLHHAVVIVPQDASPASVIDGYDLDGDGRADLTLAHRG